MNLRKHNSSAHRLEDSFKMRQSCCINTKSFEIVQEGNDPLVLSNTKLRGDAKKISSCCHPSVCLCDENP